MYVFIYLWAVKLVVLRDYFWLCIQGSLFRGTYRLPGFEPRLAARKASALPAVLLLHILMFNLHFNV